MNLLPIFDLGAEVLITAGHMELASGYVVDQPEGPYIGVAVSIYDRRAPCPLVWVLPGDLVAV